MFPAVEQYPEECFLQLLHLIRTAVEKYGRTFAVGYDLSSVRLVDFTNVVSELFHNYTTNIVPLMTSSAYLHHEGRPMLELRGIGVDKTTMNAADSAKIFQAMRSAIPSPYILLGLQHDRASDAKSDPDYHNVYIKADVIQPWAVGAYGNDNYQTFNRDTSVLDKALSDRFGIKYAPSITPGGSNRNQRGKN